MNHNFYRRAKYSSLPLLLMLLCVVSIGSPPLKAAPGTATAFINPSQSSPFTGPTAVNTAAWANPFEFAGSFGGDITTIAVSNTLAFISQGSMFTILNVADPTRPVEVSSLQTPDVLPFTSAIENTSIQLQGNLAYIQSPLGLQIVDITEPLTPTLRGHYLVKNIAPYWKPATAAKIAGQFAYIAFDYLGLQILDLSNPDNLALRGSYPTTTTVEDLDVVGNRAYMLTREALQILDITNPSNPTLLGNYATSAADHLQASDSLVYLSRVIVEQESSTFYLDIVDVSNPQSPVLLSSYTKSNYQGVLVSLEVADNRAYLGGNEVLILDVSDPRRPMLVTTFASSGRDIEILGNRMYLADIWSAGISIADISDVAHPKLLGRYRGSTGLECVRVIGSLAYITSAQTVDIIDISNPARPRRRISYDALHTQIPGICPMQVVGDLAYGADGSFTIADVSEPLSPTLLISFRPIQTEWVRGAAIQDTNAYIIDNSGLSIYDVRNPAAPILRGRWSNAGYCCYEAIVVVGDIAYVTGEGGFIEIINVSDPSSPRQLGRFRTTGESMRMVFEDHVIFVFRGYIYVIDTRDRTYPVLLNFVSTAAYIGEKYIDGFIYLLGNGGVERLDIRDPLLPIWQIGQGVVGQPSAIDLANNVLFVATRSGGLQMFRISPEQYPPRPPRIYLPLAGK